MGRGKKKITREAVRAEPESSSSPAESTPAKVVGEEEAGVEKPAQEASVQNQPVSPRPAPSPAPSFVRRLLPDLFKVALALAVVAVGSMIWYQPPLIGDNFPYVSYTFEGKTATDAKLYRPLAMPTRFYIELPKKLQERYLWFAVDRRREVAALTEAPQHRFLGWSAIKRSDPLGMDLEFRKLDHSEWQVHFFHDSIVFSNAVLTIRMDTKKYNNNNGN